MKNAKLTKFSKNHKKPSFPKLVPRGGPGLLEGRGGQNRKFDPGPPGAPGVVVVVMMMPKIDFGIGIPIKTGVEGPRWVNG